MNKKEVLTRYKNRQNNSIKQAPPSVPIATEHNPDETNAAGPDEEPPVYLSIGCGFLAVLQ
jgi:tRNA G46 methylase TrmB